MSLLSARAAMQQVPLRVLSPLASAAANAVPPVRHLSKVNPDDYGDYADPVEHTHGREKMHLLARLHGDDRFEPKAYRRGPGTKDNPNLIPSHFPNRIICCQCQPGDLHMNYMWMRKGMQRRCECGYWFTLVDADPWSM